MLTLPAKINYNTMKTIVMSAALIAATAVGAQARTITYPDARRVDTVDVYFGTQVPDPYRWLEDDNSQETAEWVKAENRLTQDYLSKIPFRNKVKKRITQLANYEKVGAPFKVKDKCRLYAKPYKHILLCYSFVAHGIYPGLINHSIKKSIYRCTGILSNYDSIGLQLHSLASRQPCTTAAYKNAHNFITFHMNVFCFCTERASFSRSLVKCLQSKGVFATTGLNKRKVNQCIYHRFVLPRRM